MGWRPWAGGCEFIQQDHYQKNISNSAISFLNLNVWLNNPCYNSSMEHYGVVKCNVYSLYMTGGACYIIVTGKKKDKNCIQRMDINMLKICI